MDLWDKAVQTLKDKHKNNIDFQRTDKNAILADVLEEVQRKKQACIERRLKYKRKSGDFVVLYDVYEKMVKWVIKFKEVGDVAMQYDSGHAALPWAAIRFFLQVSINDVQIFGSLVEGLEGVCKIIARYSIIESLYLHQPVSVGDLLEKAIITLYASILVFFSKCRKYFDLGFAQRLARGVTQVPEQSVNKYLEKIAVIDRNVNELTRIIDAERMQLSGTRQSTMSDRIDNLGNEIEMLQICSRESASRLEALLASFQNPLVRTVEQLSTLAEDLAYSKDKTQMKEERLQILRWLSNVQYKKHHQSLSQGLLKGTGLWLLGKPQFLEWRNSSVSSVLWLHGIPGSGKTCLTSTVIQQFLIEKSTCENAAPLAYFYCQRNTAEPQRSDPTEVLRAILRQLLCYNPLWQQESSTAKEYMKRKREADEDGFEISGLNILETTDQIIEIASQMPVTILIDALDECRSDQRHGLLGALDVLLEKSSHLVKVFVSSRDDVDIVLRLQKHPNIYISVRDNTGDIQRFIQSEIQKAQSDRRLLKGTISPELTELITENLTEKAGGMFLWVSLQLENLCDSRRIKVEGDLVDELARLPRSLTEMYSLLLENIGQIEQRGRTIAETVLKWLLCTTDASSRVTIAACSGTTPAARGCLSVLDILDVCSTLVVYDEALDGFQFAHLSIREFLESQPGYAPSEANSSVLERSLQTLMDFQSPEDPFRSYATYNWLFHYHNLEEQQRKKVFEIYAKRFLFKGIGSSDYYNMWASKTLGLDRRLDSDEIKLLYSWDSKLDIPFINHGRLRDDFRTPVNLASCLGWVEILDHFEARHTAEGFQASAERIMTLAVHYGQTPVIRWLAVRNIYPTEKDLKPVFHKDRFFVRSDMAQTVVEMYLLSFNILVNGQKLLAATVCCELRDMYQHMVSMDCQDQSGRTLLSHASLGSNDGNSKVIEDMLLTGTDPVAQWLARKVPLSLKILGEHQPVFYVLLMAQIFDSSVYGFCKITLQRVLSTYYYHNACLLVHSELDSILENVTMRTEWMNILRLIAMLSPHQRDASALPTRQSKKLANGSQDSNQWVDQTLLSMASLFGHEKSFQVLLDMGVDPACPAILGIRKQMMSSVEQMGNSMSVQALPTQEDQSKHDKISEELRQGPLAWAAYTGNLPLVRSILDRGLDPNINNRKGQTALYFAAQQPEDQDPRLEVDKEAIVRLLLQKGALVTSADAYSGASVLASALKARYSKVAKLLLDHGAEIPKSQINGPVEQLLSAFYFGHEGIRRTLLERAQGAAMDLPRVQRSSSGRRYSGDSWDIAAQLAMGGTIRVLGDAFK